MAFTNRSGHWSSVFGVILLAFGAWSSPLYAADTFEPNNTTATATPILVDSSRVSYISSSDDFDYYQLTVPETQQLHIRLIMPGPVNYQVDLLDWAGEPMYFVTVPVNGVELRADWTLGPGAYFLVVRGGSFDAENSYTLSVTRLLGDVSEPNDTPQSASALVVGTAATGYMFTSNDSDWYRFQVPFETHLDIALTAPANYGLVLYYDAPSFPDPWLLTFSNLPGNNERIRWTVSPGTYWVSVSTFSGSYSQAQPYSLRVQSGFFTDSYEPNNGRFGAALRRDTTIWSRLYTSNDRDSYRFGLSAAGNIRLTLTVPSTDGMRLDVYDQAGNPVASAEGMGSDSDISLSTTLSGPATYVVAVTFLYSSFPFPEQEYSLTLEGSTVGLPRRITGDFDGFAGADRVLYNPLTGVWTRENFGISVQFGEPGDVPVVGDYNGDGGADHAVYRPSTGMWYVRGQFAVQYGDRGDIPVPADYNGDSVTDVAVYRPSTGVWYVRNQFAVQHGGIGAVPIPADYNGDGSDDVAVYRVTSGVWDVRNQFRIVYGGSRDLPVPGDYNGDGRADIAVFRTATGGVWDVRGQFTYSGHTGIPMPHDYNGDGTTDLVMYNPSTHLWFSRVLLQFQPPQFGNPGEVPALRRPATIRATPGDYDGDGAADPALYRPSTGEWLIGGKFVIRHGAPGDLPAPADYDGDGVVDAGVFRPAARQWLVRNQFVKDYVGDPGDIPVAGDYTGDGIVDVKVYRPSTRVWFSSPDSVRFGNTGDVPVQGDYNGDGVTDIAVYRPSTGVWSVRNQFNVQFGDPGDVPVAADYNGDGVMDIAVYRPSTGMWYVRHQFAAQFGDSGDLPVPGDYNNDGRADVAVYRPATGVWYVRNQSAVRFGQPGDIPLASLAGR